MSTRPDDTFVVIMLPGRRGVPAALTRHHSASSYGQPVLLVGTVGYGPLERTPWGIAADLSLMALDDECPDAPPSPLDRWNALVDQYRAMGRIEGPEAAS